MQKDYQRLHPSACAAAEYAGTVKGWTGSNIRRLKNGTYELTLIWDDNDAEENMAKAPGA